jgi:hypothetical protein
VVPIVAVVAAGAARAGDGSGAGSGSGSGSGPSADDARALFDVPTPAAPAPTTPAPDPCRDGTAFGCAMPTDPLVPFAPGAVGTTLRGDVLGGWDTLPVGDASHDELVTLATGVGPGGVVPGATSVEDRWLIGGAPTDDVRGGGAGTRVPGVFLDTVDVTTGGFAARDRASTGAIIDAHLRGGEQPIRVARIWGDVLTRSPAIEPAGYVPVTGRPDDAARVTVAALLGGPLGRVAGAHLWYFVAVQPSLAPRGFERTGRSLVDVDADGVPDQTAAGLTTITVSQATEHQAGGEVPFVLRAGARRGPHQLTLTVVGAYASAPRFAPLATDEAGTVAQRELHADAIATWTGRWAGTLARVQWAWHADRTWQRAAFASAADAPQINTAFIPPPAVIPDDFDLGVACDDAATSDPYPTIVNCPLATGYFATAGAGPLLDTAADRPSLTASVAHLFGGHRVEVGATGEDARLVVTRHITGGYYRRTLFGSDQIDTRYVELGDGPDFPDACSLDGSVACRWLDSAPTTYRTRYLAGWLEDTWRPGPGVAADYGVRWESMLLTGTPVLHQLLPRASVAWDPLGHDRSRVFAGFARTAPLLPGRLAETLGGRPTELTTVVLPIGQSDFIDTFRGLRVADGLDPMIVDDVTAGADLALSSWVRLRIAGQWRWLRRGLDSNGSLLVNPGADGGPAADRRSQTLTVELGTRPTPDPVLAFRIGYTYATATGNWDGPADPVLGATWYAGPDFSGAPTTGALASDLHHRFFAEVATGRDLGGGTTLIVAGRATLASGRPVGAFDGTGAVILARGTLPRTPLVPAVDLRIGLQGRRGARIGLELLDAFARDTATAVDERYTRDAARPIDGGTASDLVFLRADDGSTPRRNPGFGRAIAYQSPFTLVAYFRLPL